MVFLNQISFKYYETLGICYILYYLDVHQKEYKSKAEIAGLYHKSQMVLIYVSGVIM